MTVREPPDVDYLRECFRLDPQTGDLYWLERPRAHFPTDQAHQQAARKSGSRADLNTYPTTGYRRVRLRVGGEIVTISAHRLVFALTHGRWPALVIDHIDGSRTNNAPRNLRDVSCGENVRAAFARRRERREAA